MVSALQRLPKNLVRPVAMRYIAGEKLEDAVRVAQVLNARGIMATMDVLGENVSTAEESLKAVQACEEVLKAIGERRLNASLSVKPTQVGLKIDEDFCHQNLRRILVLARRNGNFVRLDMEDSSTTELTLDLYQHLLGEGWDNVGAVIQAYLRRSEEDIKKLISMRGNIRVVKGIYIEPETIAYQDREQIRRNYLKILRLLLESGCYAAIATHDDFLVNGAYEMIREVKPPKTAYEFQMLYGVKERLRDRIVAEGHRMRIYVPFGEEWHSYSVRRFKENPQIARYILRAMLLRS